MRSIGTSSIYYMVFYILYLLALLSLIIASFFFLWIYVFPQTDLQNAKTCNLLL